MEDHSCGICNNRPRAVRNLPCGHGGVCERCTIELVLRAVPSGLNCIYCRCTVSRLMVAPVTMATAGAGQVLPRRMPTNLAVPEPEGHIFESVQAFVLAMLDHADAEVANAARTALARKQEEQEGRTELMDAAEEGSAETVMALLAAPGIDVNAADRDGRTALMLAAIRGHAETVTALLAAPGLDVNAADGGGWTTLMRAAYGGHAETVTALLAAPGLDVNVADGDGRTALMRAAGGGHAETVTALLAAPGLNVNATDRRDGRTALMWAADKGRTQMVRTLLAAPGLDVNAADGAGRTALALAKARRHFRSAYLLRAAGSVEEKDNTCCIIN